MHRNSKGKKTICETPGFGRLFPHQRVPSVRQPWSAHPSPGYSALWAAGPCWQQIAADPSTDTILGVLALWPAGHSIFLPEVCLQSLLLTFQNIFKTASIIPLLSPENGKFQTFKPFNRLFLTHWLVYVPSKIRPNVFDLWRKEKLLWQRSS